MSTFNNKLSLYIPRITPESASEEWVKHQFYSQNVGIVERVDLILKNPPDNGPEYYQAFLHFKQWFDNAVTRNIQERIEAGDVHHPARLVYNDPWYWILLRNSNPRSEAERRIEGRIHALEIAMQERVLINNNNQKWTEGIVEDLQRRLWDLELEYQAIMHSDAAREGLTDEATAPPPSWATQTDIGDDMTCACADCHTESMDQSIWGPTPTAYSFATVDDDREIAKWEDKQRITPRAPPTPYRGLNQYPGTKHGGRDDWCDA